MKKFLTIFSVLLIASFLLTGCSSNKNKSIDDLVALFNSKGFNGTKTNKWFAAIGAIDGCGYENADFTIELYKYNDSKSIPDVLPYKNGNFGMIIQNPTSGNINQMIIDTFNSF